MSQVQRRATAPSQRRLICCSTARALLAHHLQRPYSAPAPQSPAPTRTVLISALGWTGVLPPSTADQAITSLNWQTNQPTTPPASSSSNHHTDVQLRSARPAPFSAAQHVSRLDLIRFPWSAVTAAASLRQTLTRSARAELKDQPNRKPARRHPTLPARRPHSPPGAELFATAAGETFGRTPEVGVSGFCPFVFGQESLNKALSLATTAQPPFSKGSSFTRLLRLHPRGGPLVLSYSTPIYPSPAPARDDGRSKPRDSFLSLSTSSSKQHGSPPLPLLYVPSV